MDVMVLENTWFIGSQPTYVSVDAAGAGVTCPYSASVTVVEARGLKRSDIFTADPFAWLRLGGSSHKTNVCRSTRCRVMSWGVVSCFRAFHALRSFPFFRVPTGMQMY